MYKKHYFFLIQHNIRDKLVGYVENVVQVTTFNVTFGECVMHSIIVFVIKLLAKISFNNLLCDFFRDWKNRYNKYVL